MQEGASQCENLISDERERVDLGSACLIEPFLDLKGGRFK